jgi:hypothetical protein
MYIFDHTWIFHFAQLEKILQVSLDFLHENNPNIKNNQS